MPYKNTQLSPPSGETRRDKTANGQYSGPSQQGHQQNGLQDVWNAQNMGDVSSNTQDRLRKQIGILVRQYKRLVALNHGLRRRLSEGDADWNMPNEPLLGIEAVENRYRINPDPVDPKIRAWTEGRKKPLDRRPCSPSSTSSPSSSEHEGRVEFEDMPDSKDRPEFEYHSDDERVNMDCVRSCINDWLNKTSCVCYPPVQDSKLCAYISSDVEGSSTSTGRGPEINRHIHRPAPAFTVPQSGQVVPVNSGRTTEIGGHSGYEADDGADDGGDDDGDTHVKCGEKKRAPRVTRKSRRTRARRIRKQPRGHSKLRRKREPKSSTELLRLNTLDEAVGGTISNQRR